MKELKTTIYLDDLEESIDLTLQCQKIEVVYLMDFYKDDLNKPEQIYIKYTNDDGSKNIIKNYMVDYGALTIGRYKSDYIDEELFNGLPIIGNATLKEQVENSGLEYRKLDYGEWLDFQKELSKKITKPAKWCIEENKMRDKLLFIKHNKEY